MGADDNGRIRLTWGQIAWGIGMMMMIGGAWADLRIGQARMEEKYSERTASNTARISVLENRANEWHAVGEANAAEGTKPRR